MERPIGRPGDGVELETDALLASESIKPSDPHGAPQARWCVKLTRPIVEEMRAARAGGMTIQKIWERWGLPRGMSFDGVRAVLRRQCWK